MSPGIQEIFRHWGRERIDEKLLTAETQWLFKTETLQDNKGHPFPSPYQAIKHRVKSKKITLGERQECEKRPLLRKRYMGRSKTYWKTSL